VSGEKARLLYETLDKNSHVYRVVPDKAVRSRMNVCFRVAGGDAEKEKMFLDGATKRGLLGIKGHRSVGGIRASNCEWNLPYSSGFTFCHHVMQFSDPPANVIDNAVSLEAVKKLVQYLEDYAKAA